MMDELKLLDGQLSTLHIDDFQENVRLCISAVAGKKVSSRIIGFQQTNWNQYLICMNDIAYLFQENKVVAKVIFRNTDHDCAAYMYISELPPLWSNGNPAHVFLQENGTIEFYEQSVNMVSFMRVISLPNGVCTVPSRNCVTAFSNASIFFSFDCHIIFSLNLSMNPTESEEMNIAEIYRLESGVLLFIGHLQNGKELVCIYKSAFNGAVYAEYACLVKKKYVTKERFFLWSGCSAEVIMKQISDDWVIGFTAEETWSFRSFLPPIRLKNKGNFKGEIISLQWFMRDQYSIHLEVVSASGLIFTGDCGARAVKNGGITWLRSHAPALLCPNHARLAFASRLYDQTYLIASNLNGVSLFNLKNSNEVKQCSFESVVYFDASYMPENAIKKASSVFCGAYDEYNGFMEKRTFNCENATKLSATVLSSHFLMHKPVSHIWPTSSGLAYESMGELYSVGSNKKLSGFDGGIWFTSDGLVIEDKSHDIISVNPLQPQDEKSSAALVTLRKKGLLEIKRYASRKEKIIFQHDLGVPVIDTAVASSYFYENFHTLISYEYGWLIALVDNKIIGKFRLNKSFLVSQLCIKCLLRKRFYIASSMDGRCLVFLPDTAEPILIIEGSNAKSYIFDLGEESEFFLVYNRFDFIVVDLSSLTYRKLDFLVEPYLLTSNHRSSKNICSFYVLSYQWSLHLIEWDIRSLFRTSNLSNVQESIFFNFKESIPSQIIPLRKTNLAVVAVTNFKRLESGLKLFDLSSMRIIKSYCFSGKCSNIILRALWSDTSKINSFEDFMSQNMLLVYFVKDGVASFKLFSIQNGQFFLQQEETLIEPAVTVMIHLEKGQVSFEGQRKQVYEIIVDRHRRICSLKYSFDTAEALESMFTDAKGFNMNKKIDIVKVVAKKQVERKLSFAKASSQTAPDIMRRFVSAGSHYKVAREYVAMVDCNDVLNLYQIHHRQENGKKIEVTSLCQVNFDSRIVNVSPVPCVLNREQRWNAVAEREVTSNEGLFVVTCSDGRALILSELIANNSVLTRKKVGRRNLDLNSASFEVVATKIVAA